jgi:hypothetical protein
MNSSAPQVLLVGVDHRIQYMNADCGPKWLARIKEFQDYLFALAIDNEVSLIAEEFSEEALSMNSATGATVRESAQRSNCAHLFCEPSKRWRDGRSDNLSGARGLCCTTKMGVVFDI